MRRILPILARLPLAALVLLAAACSRGGHGSLPEPASTPASGGDASVEEERRDAQPRESGGADREASPPPAPPAPLAPLDRIREVAEGMLDGEGPARWAREARLGPEELSNRYATVSEAGVEVFSVDDAQGYEGYYKCNLFALEVVYRAGFLVPVISRVRGWTYPGPLGISRMIEGERMSGDWAAPADALDLAELQAAVEEGRVLLAVGLGLRGRHGHVGLVERVHGIERDVEGRIRVLDYRGWEANPEGASFAERRWGTARFARIHLVELRLPRPGERQVVALGPPPDEPSSADVALLDEAALAEAERNPRRGDMSAWPGGSRIPEYGAPRLPVVHTVLGQDSVFGRVVDVDRVIEPEGEAAADALRRTRVKRPVIDVDRVLGAGQSREAAAEETR